jgi:uncharacterized protein
MDKSNKSAIGSDSALEVEYQLLPELAELGSSRQLSGKLALTELRKGSQVFRLADGIDYDLELSNTGEGILLRGKARTSGITECARCLEDANFSVEGDVESYYVLNTHRLDEETSSDEFTLLDASGKVDLGIPILASIIYELPLVILCRENCAGLCPSCGINLNEGSCNCDEEIDPSNPFYALKDLV